MQRPGDVSFKGQNVEGSESPRTLIGDTSVRDTSSCHHSFFRFILIYNLTFSPWTRHCPIYIYTLRLVAIKISFMHLALQRQFRLYIPFLGIARPQPQFPHSCVLSDLYIPRISLHISSSRTGRPTVGIYNSLTDTQKWKLGLRPRYSFSGNICFKFSAFCLCSVYLFDLKKN
jgi:hypothetical protein